LKDVDAATRDKVIQAFRTQKPKRNAEQQALLKTHAKAVDIKDEEVAKRLIELGYTRVRPLAGGLDAWIAAGHDVERHSGVT